MTLLRLWNVEADALYIRILYIQFSILLDVFTGLKSERVCRNYTELAVSKIFLPWQAEFLRKKQKSGSCESLLLRSTYFCNARYTRFPRQASPGRLRPSSFIAFARVPACLLWFPNKSRRIARVLPILPVQLPMHADCTIRPCSNLPVF